jgi:hypothetical protein
VSGGRFQVQRRQRTGDHFYLFGACTSRLVDFKRMQAAVGSLAVYFDAIPLLGSSSGLT